jgi:hypothetical protein
MRISQIVAASCLGHVCLLIYQDLIVAASCLGHMCLLPLGLCAFQAEAEKTSRCCITTFVKLIKLSFLKKMQ